MRHAIHTLDTVLVEAVPIVCERLADSFADAYGELPKIQNDESWSGIAVFYLSFAVELWTCNAQSAIEFDAGQAENA